MIKSPNNEIAEGVIKMGADLVAVGRAVVVDPEWLSEVRSKCEASIRAALPKDELEIAKALSIHPRMVEYLLSRPGGRDVTGISDKVRTSRTFR